jgi:Uncharacterized conserved protein
MAFDYKKEYKEFYLPKDKPSIVAVPQINYIAVRGCGDPNEDSGQYKEAMNILYSVEYTIKMSKMGDHRIEGYFDYVVPPLEGLWWQEVDGKPVAGFDYGDKGSMCWISIIRLPDFVTKADFDWAVAEASRKKGIDASKAEFLTLEEGLCAQIMHHGSYDDEPATIAILLDFIKSEGYSVDIDQVNRFHHEIYLGDPRKTAPEKLRTVIRYPVKK